MFLRDIFNLIGFTKLQQIILIKILFLTGSLGFVEPSSIADIKETVKINEEFLSSEIPETLLLQKNLSSISEEKAQEILNVAEFESQDKAFHWLNSTLKRKFTFKNEEENTKGSSPEYQKNLQELGNNFLSSQIIPENQAFKSIVMIAEPNQDLSEFISFSAKLLKENKISSEKFYFILPQKQIIPQRKNPNFSLISNYFPKSQSNFVEVIDQDQTIEGKFSQYAIKLMEKFPSQFSKYKPQSKILFISAQPLPRYQLALYKSALPKEANLSMIGFRTKIQKNIASILEEISVELDLFEKLILKK